MEKKATLWAKTAKLTTNLKVLWKVVWLKKRQESLEAHVEYKWSVCRMTLVKRHVY